MLPIPEGNVRGASGGELGLPIELPRGVVEPRVIGAGSVLAIVAVVVFGAVLVSEKAAACLSASGGAGAGLLNLL